MREVFVGRGLSGLTVDVLVGAGVEPCCSLCFLQRRFAVCCG
jgi:hypothetical protein